MPSRCWPSRSVNWQASQTGHNPDSLQQQLDSLQTQLVNLQARYTDDYPDVIKVKNDIAAVQKGWQRTIVRRLTTRIIIRIQRQRQPESLSSSRNCALKSTPYDQVIAEKSKRIKSRSSSRSKCTKAACSRLPESSSNIRNSRAVMRQLWSHTTICKKSGMRPQWRRTWNGNSKANSSACWTQRAVRQGILPEPPVFATGGLGGGLARLAITFLIEMQNSSLRTERDVEFALRLPVLAMVPAIQPLSSKKPTPTGALPANPSLNVGARA